MASKCVSASSRSAPTACDEQLIARKMAFTHKCTVRNSCVQLPWLTQSNMWPFGFLLKTHYSNIVAVWGFVRYSVVGHCWVAFGEVRWSLKRLDEAGWYWLFGNLVNNGVVSFISSLLCAQATNYYQLGYPERCHNHWPFCFVLSLICFVFRGRG